MDRNDVIKLNGKAVRPSTYGIVRASWSDGTTVVIGEDDRTYRVPQQVVTAAGLYGALQVGRRVRIRVDGDDADTATLIELA